MGGSLGLNSSFAFEESFFECQYHEQIIEQKVFSNSINIYYVVTHYIQCTTHKKALIHKVCQ